MTFFFFPALVTVKLRGSSYHSQIHMLLETKSLPIPQPIQQLSQH
jgi:hypothetical protein